MDQIFAGFKVEQLDTFEDVVVKERAEIVFFDVLFEKLFISDDFHTFILAEYMTYVIFL